MMFFNTRPPVNTPVFAVPIREPESLTDEKTPEVYRGECTDSFTFVPYKKDGTLSVRKWRAARLILADSKTEAENSARLLSRIMAIESSGTNTPFGRLLNTYMQFMDGYKQFMDSYEKGMEELEGRGEDVV